MSDVLGHSSFQGIFFLFSSALAAVIFLLVMLVTLFSWQPAGTASASLVVALNLLAALWAFDGLGGKLAKLADYASPIWFALSIAGFFYFRNRLGSVRKVGERRPGKAKTGEEAEFTYGK